MTNFWLTYTLDFVDELSAVNKDNIYNEILKKADNISPILSFSCKEEKSPRQGCKLRIEYKLSFVSKEKLNKEQIDEMMNIVINSTKDYKHDAVSCLIAPIK